MVLIKKSLFSDNILIKVPVSWKIVPILSPVDSAQKEITKPKSFVRSHLKTPDLSKILNKSCISRKTSPKNLKTITALKESKTPFSSFNHTSTNSRPKLSTSSVSNENDIGHTSSSIDFTKPKTVNFSKLNTNYDRKLTEPQSIGWKINSPKSFVLEDVIKTNNFNITKFSQVVSSDSGDTCLDSVTLNYPISETNDKNDIVIDSGGYSNEKDKKSNYCLTGNSESDQKSTDNISDNIKKSSTIDKNSKTSEQSILNPKKKLIERAKYSMNNSDEFNEEKSKCAKTVLANQNIKDDRENNNVKFSAQMIQSDKSSTFQNVSKERKVYKHLSSQKTSSLETTSPPLNSVVTNVKNSAAIHCKINNKTKNSVKSTAPSATNNKITKHRKYIKKDIINCRKKLKSPPMPDSIKNIKIKEVYPDHWNCVYCSKEITYNDIYDHSTTCLHIDTDEYGKHLICCICKYATMKLSNLRKHIWTHTGEKPFKCSKCSYNSTQSSNLRMHLKIKHSIIN